MGERGREGGEERELQNDEGRECVKEGEDRQRGRKWVREREGRERERERTSDLLTAGSPRFRGYIPGGHYPPEC